MRYRGKAGVERAGCLVLLLALGAVLAAFQALGGALSRLTGGEVAAGLVVLCIVGGAAAAARARGEKQRQLLAAEAAEDAARCQRERREALAARFGGEAADAIMDGRVWRGATVEMLIESRGRPDVIDERVLKTKTKHVFKYHPLARGAYQTRVTLEDGIVVGWEDRE